jgi:four helix bundle protein
MTMGSKQWYTNGLPNGTQERRERFPRTEGMAEGASVDLLAVYQTTASFPREELYGLTSQLRRCSSSIPANLAEGCGRNGDAEFARFCSIAMGSASELEYHLLLAKELNLIKPKDHAELSERATELKRMLTALLQKLKADR